MTALLSERQQKARDLARELAKLPGCWITSPLPLAPDSKLRLQVLDKHKSETLQLLKDWGWSPSFVTLLPRIDAASFKPATVWEIDLPPARQPIADDRPKVSTEVIDREARAKAAAEIAAFRKHLGWTK